MNWVRLLRKMSLFVLVIMLSSMGLLSLMAHSLEGTCIAPPDGLVSWWPGDGNARDISGGNDGVLHGATYAPGMVGRAFSLDGIDDYIRIPDNPSLQLRNGLTIDAWINSASNDGPRVIVSKWNDDTREWSHIFKDHNASDKLRIELSESVHNDLADLEGRTSIPLGRWVHVATTYDSREGMVRLYFNGVEDASRYVGRGRLIDYSNTDLLIGAGFTGSGIRENFAGLIDEVEIFNRALSREEIASIYAAGSAGKCRPAPTITGITPDSGVPGETVRVTDLAGTGFRDGASVRLEKAGEPDVDATDVVVVSDTRITCEIPLPRDVAVGTWDVVVENDDAQEGRLKDGFRIIDVTPPEITINTPADGAEYLLNQVVLADWNAEDEEGGSGLKSATGTVPSGDPIDTATVGAKTFKVTAEDNAGNKASRTVTYNVRYDFGGILQPINADGSSVFKLGSTVPVKFQLRDAGGNLVADAVARIFLAKISNCIVGSDIEAVSTCAATTGNLFRYDASSGQYIFNLSTRGLSRGTWRITIRLDDGTAKYVIIGLR